MTDYLRKSMAPISDGAWQEIEQQAGLTLKGNLMLRGLVDFSGPHGLQLAAINTGKLQKTHNNAKDGVAWSLRASLPLVEVRTPLRLDRAELDSVERGAADPDLEALEEAARRMAIFEENVLLNGLSDAGIQGLAKASAHQPVAVKDAGADSLFSAIADGILALEQAGINGPYALLLGDDDYQALRIGTPGGYPIARRAGELLAGGIHWSPAVKGGLLLSRRGGDFEMTSGQDIAIGYQEHDAESVTLFFTESFTFRVLEPAAAIMLAPPTGRK